jgi:hypothetical protein
MVGQASKCVYDKGDLMRTLAFWMVRIDEKASFIWALLAFEFEETQSVQYSGVIGG